MHLPVESLSNDRKTHLLSESAVNVRVVGARIDGNHNSLSLGTCDQVTSDRFDRNVFVPLQFSGLVERTIVDVEILPTVDRNSADVLN